MQIASSADVLEMEPLSSIVKFTPDKADKTCRYSLEEESGKLRHNIDQALTSAGENFLGYLYRVWEEVDTKKSGDGREQQETALFINGIYEGNGETMIHAQSKCPGLVCYAQPYGPGVIQCLKKNQPSPKRTMRVYFSTTIDLRHVHFTGQIIRWEDKQMLSRGRKRSVTRHLRKHQPGEVALFKGTEEKTANARNLISVVDVRRLPTPIPLERLIKVSDNSPRKPRTQSGGFSEVYDDGWLEDVEVISRTQHDAEIEREIRKSWKRSDSKLDQRLRTALIQPEKIQITSVGYKRNPDVIVKVLRRANGICECCGHPAPFNRASDGTPFLEVHHIKPLSEGGPDTVGNAEALCPNCHRMKHFG